MDDREREILVKNSAYGFVGIICLLFVVAAIFGKAYARQILIAVVPFYSLYYVLMYRYISGSYEDGVKRISAFGIIGRGTFVGAVYYLSLLILAVLAALFVLVIFNLLQSN
jgi:hypothetical protein